MQLALKLLVTLVLATLGALAFFEISYRIYYTSQWLVIGLAFAVCVCCGWLIDQIWS